MLMFRQTQARKSILVKIPSLSSAFNVKMTCSYYGNVVNTVSYASKDMAFLLVEYSTENEIIKLKETIRYQSREYLCAVTPLYSYKDLPQTVKLRGGQLQKSYACSAFVAPTEKEMVKKLEETNSISEQMILLYNVLKLPDFNIRLRFYTAEQISFYLSRLFTNISVLPFGSSVNGFGQLGCDLDLLCQIDRVKQSKSDSLSFLTQTLSLNEKNEKKVFLETIGTLMKVFVPGVTNMRKILEARVPIIKFFNTYTNMQCDLSSSNVLASIMSQLLYTYAEFDWCVKPLVCTIRNWARNRSLTKDEPGQWITNFSLTLLIIFYLQTKYIVPCLGTLQDVARHNTSKLQAVNQQPKNEILYQLLYGFFEYYSIFDFKTQAICIQEGCPRQKKSYAPLYIYNPLESTLNVSRNVTTIQLTQLIDNFRNGLHIMLSVKEEDILMCLLNLKKTPEMCNNTPSIQISQKESLNQEMFTEQRNANIL
ncbi:Poly(A) RNA polymerase, mitochondrial [Habropoda laboriosa]|uniref:Poly(A) RNA polymerase, mitochondrial n=2 Tax=Habropoda laboriosa TaxID=597456 RepID=A0A0L7RD25_9HYME|nr:Poly(A) RNA polymerase, mitochondrial [Habropoda laboriosa]